MKKRMVAAVTAVALAVFGVLALVNYTRGAEDRAFAGAELVEVLQVQTDVPANTPADRVAGSVDLVKVPVSAKVDQALVSLDDVSTLSTNMELKKGEQVLRSRFGENATKVDTSVPAGYQEVTISVAAPRVLGGKIKVGDRVGILASFKRKGGEAGDTKFLQQQVQVTRVVSGGLVDSEDGSGDALLVTLAVRTMDAEKIVNTAEFGMIWLTLQNENTDTDGNKRISAEDVI